MTVKEVQELLKLINKTNLAEVKIKDGDFEIAIRTDKFSKERTTRVVAAQPAPMMSMPAPAPTEGQAAPAAPAAAAPTTEGTPEADASEANYVTIKSPMIGTFYRSSSPDKPPFVKVGDSIGENDIVCIIEAMKLFNEIEAELTGKIVKILVEDSQPVEYDQPLFLVDPKG